MHRISIRRLSTISRPTGTCQSEDMVEPLAGFTWNQVFSAIDRLSRDGTLVLQRPARFGYETSITSGRKRTLEAQVSR